MTEHSFICEACGGRFLSETGVETEVRLLREDMAFADMPDAPMSAVCDDCFRKMRAFFPTLDARFKLEGL